MSKLPPRGKNSADAHGGVECVIVLHAIHHEWDGHEEQHPYICGTNKHK